MTDEQDGPSLHPEQEAQIRALLAEAGTVTGPTPPEVVTRLDDTLARLQAERVAEAPSTPTEPATDASVVPLRRWFPRLAVAAAAVLVIGGGAVSAAQLGLLGGSGDSASQSTAGGAAADQDAKSELGAESGGGSDSGSGPTGAASPDASALLAPDTAVVRRWPAVSAATFTADVTTLLRDGAERGTLDSSTDSSSGTAPEAEPPPSSAGDGQSAREAPQALRATQCPGPPVDDGSTTSPVRYDETAAVLVVHPATDGTRLVEAWSCAGDRVLDSTRVPAGASGP